MARESHLRGVLTSAEFKAAARAFPRLSEKALTAGRAVLVAGGTLDATATDIGVSRQMVHSWCSKIFSAYQPPGWETALVTLPAEKMQIIRQWEIEARAQLKGAKVMT